MIFINTNIQLEIEKIKKEIEMNNLVLPTAFEFEMADYALTHIEQFKPFRTFPCQSNYSNELKKVYKELNRHFKDEELNLKKNRFVPNFYVPTSEINDRTYKILNEIKITPKSDEDYQSVFEIQPGKIIPIGLNIPYQLDNLSYIYLGHEVIHLLKDTNLNEYKNYFRHSEILPMLYEFIQMKYKREDTRKNIISQRMLMLSSMNQNVRKAKKIIGNTADFEIYKLPDYQYFISFYYTILLYELYLTKYPKTILREFKNVLLHEKTTQELLEYFGIYEQLEIFDFGKGCERLLKIVS